jgi:hypothetical protein
MNRNDVTTMGYQKARSATEQLVLQLNRDCQWDGSADWNLTASCTAVCVSTANTDRIQSCCWHTVLSSCEQLITCGRLQCWWRGFSSSGMLHYVAADLARPDPSKAIRIFGNEGASFPRNFGTCKLCHIRPKQGPNWFSRPNVRKELTYRLIQ